ncbi:transcription termination factor NusA [Candidatus Karelsulcia muelleri]|uniref:transcription termination factor NusA n=1 Tax=Candidatus Karelsulcia muelleri TaxID=336810 RepID=UPI0013A63B97
MSIIKKSFIFFLKKKYGKLKNYKIFFNYKNGEIEIWRDLKIVSDEIIKNLNKQIEISKAIKIKKNLKIGDYLKEKIEYQQLGKKFLFSLKKDLLYKFKKFEIKNKFQIFKKKIGEIIYAKVDYIMNDNIFFENNENNKMILLKEEQIPNEKLKKGNYFFLLIKKVKFIKNKIYLLLSRKDKNFLKKLLELEIPEISNGLIIIKKIVRIAGERSKIAIKSKNKTIDPIGTCVGLKGSKLKNIIKEINNEILDIINYSSNIELYLTRSISPAKVAMIKIDRKKKLAFIYVNSEEIKKAIGNKKTNLRLASKLTGYKIYILNIKKKNE